MDIFIEILELLAYFAGVFLYAFTGYIALSLAHILRPSLLTLWAWPLTIVVYWLLRWRYDLKCAVDYHTLAALAALDKLALERFAHDMNQDITKTQLNMVRKVKK